MTTTTNVETAPVTAGVTTSEWKGKTVLQLLVLTLSAFDVAISNELAAILVTALEGLYMVVRAQVKAASYKSASVVEK